MSELYKVVLLLLVLISAYGMGRDDCENHNFVRLVIMFVVFAILCFLKYVVRVI